MTFDCLSQSSPHLIAQLNKSYRREALPRLYRIVPVNRKSIVVFDNHSTSNPSLLPYPATYTEVLRVVNLESALLFASYRLQYAGEDIDAYSSPIIPRVKRVEFSWAVFEERFFKRFSGRMGDGGSQGRTLQHELKPESQLQECLLHIDCSNKQAEISSYELKGIPRYLSGALKHAKTLTLVLHVPETGQMSKAVTKEEGAAESKSTNGVVPVPSRNVIDAFAALIGDLGLQILLDALEGDIEAMNEVDVMRELADNASTYEVCCPNAGHVEQLARSHFKSRHTRAANLEWPVQFLELDEGTVDEYDLWKRAP
ncbi:hypothetical protein L198_02469 [Cryptococcus wingfieldii CBS 7118]|uniref:Uncharacterized protein n=1 Tax=Cryptococcus wingfieldii CBS 7118 TaxID=1295528 RepID=A0A1E3JRW3_9TREE|nr:hypothetical protein L198_02469 [Cryptococcus wingfieldii CBS 7118]ODO03619.1 hypothetical protein L198_02469 [Cryptococcus wingfieldii CBS 7118]